MIPRVVVEQEAAMDAAELRAKQAPVKRLFRERPEAAQQTLVATGVIVPDQPTCDVGTFLGSTPAGLHVSTGGDGSLACSAQMLLEALVGCAGVTLAVVAKALDVELMGVEVRAEGDLDFKGTMGVDRLTPVGFQRIRLLFELETSADDQLVAKLLELTERYCVVQQTLQQGVQVELKRKPLG